MLAGELKPIANSKDLANVLLSKTQRKTPTVVHPGYKITRIRSFYMRKVKFFEDGLEEKLDEVLNSFPKLEEVHPFYRDLINVLYDKDHYKLALGHIKATRSMAESITRDYLKLLKYADSLYRCKMLKKACLGRICTTLRKINSSLAYLEEVRKHMSRLPSINPFERTLLLTGYPNVGKSSFINRVTRANVDVQPYPFTTQSLFVGHFEHQSVRWQVIDSPGLLDHPLEEMNTIEMQSISALAHLRACCLFFLDLSEQCGYSLAKQAKLFRSLKPLYSNKPVLVLFSKADLRKHEELTPEEQAAIQDICSEYPCIELSNVTEEGVQLARNKACELLAEFRLKQNIDKVVGNDRVVRLDENFARGVYIATPKKRDEVERPTSIPESVRQGIAQERQTFRQIQEQNGGPGVFSYPVQEAFLLKNEDWKYDVPPEFFNGKNVADFVDPDILERLEELEREEDQMMAQMDEEEEPLDEEIEEEVALVRHKKQKFKSEHHLRRHQTNYARSIKPEQAAELEGMVEDKQQFRERNRSRSRSRMGRREDAQLEEELGPEERVRLKRRSQSRSRSKGTVVPESVQQKRGKKEVNKLTKEWRKSMKINESDRLVPTKMPKHLYSGKTDLGTRNRR